MRLLEDGADILDVGGESTRPGAKVLPSTETAGKITTPAGQPYAEQQPVSEKEELERVIPVIAALKQKRPQAVISVDTYKANVARAAVDSRRRNRQRCERISLGSTDGEYAGWVEMRRRADAHARASGGVANFAAGIRCRDAGET